MADNTQAVHKLFNLLISKDFDVTTTDINGKQVSDLEEAEMLTFDFIANGKNYGKVSLIVDVANQMTIFYGANISKSMKAQEQQQWFDLIKQLKNFAIRHANGSKIEDISRLKYFGKKRDVQEAYTGTSRTSYNRAGKGDAKIIIKHSKKLGEDDKRFRNIRSIFIENEGGERFKLPFISLPGARAMARHVTNSGTPYDSFGQHICDMVNNVGVLSGFVRRSGMFEDGETSGYVTSGRNHYKEMREGLKRISGKRGYHIYKEAWTPDDADDSELDEDRVRRLFTRDAINAKVENAIPLLAKLEAKDNENAIWENTGDFDLFAVQEEAIRNHIASSHRGMFEDKEDYGKLQSILNSFKSEKPIKGQDYVYVSVLTMMDPDFTFVSNIAYLSKPYRLKNIIDGKYIFDINGSACKFPNIGNTTNDELKKIYLFKDSNTFEKFRTAIGISLKTCVSYKRLDIQSNELKEFESWADDMVGGVLNETDETISDVLTDFFSKEQPYGLDAMNVTDALFDVIDNEDFHSMLEYFAERDPDRDSRKDVMHWLELHVVENPDDELTRKIESVLPTLRQEE